MWSSTETDSKKELQHDSSLSGKEGSAVLSSLLGPRLRKGFQKPDQGLGLPRKRVQGRVPRLEGRMYFNGPKWEDRNIHKRN